MSATNTQHNYAFDVVPNDGTAAQHFTGSYAVSTQVAHEDYGKGHWDFACPADPWTYGKTLTCTQPASLAGSSLYEPAGAQVLSEIFGGYATITAALNKALGSTPLDPTVAVEPPLTSPKVSDANSHHVAELTGKPDLQAVGITGPVTLTAPTIAVYTATIRNNGAAANGNVEVVIGVSGALQQLDSFQESNGFNCAPVSGSDTNSFRCTGGTLAAGQTATISFRVHAASSGPGSIVLSLNPSRSSDESDYGNDLAFYTVSVSK